MDSRSEKKMSLGVDSDMISNLPQNVTDQILIHLPIRDAVRTSVLSTNWRYKWTTIPQLVFKDPCNNKDKLINFIDQVLLSHSGVIHKFELSTWCLPVSCKINCWVLFLSRRNIKEFVLRFLGSRDERYKLPTCFFSAQQLCSLKLYRCVLKPPPTFTGFSNLKSLYLWDTKFDNGGFEGIISKISVLERLTWKFFDHIDHVNICFPNLKYLCLRGSFEDITFENTPLLSDVSITLTNYIIGEKFEKFLQSEIGNAVKVLNSLPSLRKLVVQQYFLEFLTLSKIPEKLPSSCHHLNSLTLHLNFKFVNEICVALCLLNSSPNLRELGIIYRSVGENHNIENFWEERTRIDWNMHGLQVVKILDFTGFELELEFIKILLANSPKLEMLSLEPDEYCDTHKFLKELVRFQRASPKAVIEFLEPDDE